jgi:hypothetical protein
MSNCHCTNPCSSAPVNTAACESVASQVANFTQQFFGDVVKTEVDGVVSWTLPCNLSVGLPENPRSEGEGLACYFLRLLGGEIVGLTGPAGADGAAGEAGGSAYTLLTAGFAMPTLGSPSVQVATAYNPAIPEGLDVFIAGAGWFNVAAKDETGTLWLTLVNPLLGATGWIPAGAIVVPTGYSITGPIGATGPVMEQRGPR